MTTENLAATRAGVAEHRTDGQVRAESVVCGKEGRADWGGGWGGMELEMGNAK